MTGDLPRGRCSVVHDSGGDAAVPPVVLVHGVGGHARQWPPEVLGVAARRVIAIDLPGHGTSPAAPERSVGGYARAVTELLDGLEIPSAIVAGHSMGGAIALTLALEAPGRIAGLVLLATGARLRCTQALLDETARPVLLPRTARDMADWSFGRNAREAMKEAFAADMAAARPGLLHAGFSACDAFDVMERLAEIRAPALVVCGDDDRLTPPRYAEKLAGAIPSARLVLVPGAGHMVMVEEPALVARAMAEFLERR